MDTIVVMEPRAFKMTSPDGYDEGYVSSSDLDLFTCVDDAEEIVSALERFCVNRAAGDGAT